MLTASAGATVMEDAPSGMRLVSLWGQGWTCGATDCQRTDPLPPSASYPPIYVMVSVSKTATGTQTDVALVAGFGFQNASATDPTPLNLSNPCDANRDAVVSAADVQYMINEALGLRTAWDDVNGYGVVNVADVQTVLNGVRQIPGACPAI